jgi:Protein of unknown function (DUF2971)
VKATSMPIAEAHPQLFHYTNAAGLVGILQSQTLWATHYKYLNDSEETRFFFKNELPKIFQQVYLDNGKSVESALCLGTEYANSLAERLLTSTNGGEPLAEAYVTSFCAAIENNNRVNDHGLLSQWRGYGKDGGYALVFETARLSELLFEFMDAYENSGDLLFGDVVYSSDEGHIINNEFDSDLEVIKTFLSNRLQGCDDSEVLPKIYGALTRCACRYKHWGFKEENEVRLVFIPHIRTALEDAAAGQISSTPLPIQQNIRGGTHVPYVALLQGVTSKKKRLPISRVIVGPCAVRERDRRVRAVEILLQNYHIDAKVTVSEIPYIG